MDEAEAYFEGPFWDALHHERPLSPSAELGDLWGAPLAPQFARFIDFVAAQPAHAWAELGPFVGLSAADFLPGPTNALTFMLKQPFRRMALLAGAVAIGTTHGGDIWLVEAAPHDGRHRVLLVDHDDDSVEPIADSLESFAWLCHLLASERPPTDPDWLLLHGRVRAQREVPVPATVTPWSVDSAVPARYRAHGDLRAALDHGPKFAVTAATVPEPASPSELVAAALRIFLREDPGLGEFLKGVAEHPARIVRDTGVILRRRAGHVGYENRLRSLGT